MASNQHSPVRQRYFDSTDPHALCELAALRLDAVQVLLKVLLDETSPDEGSRVPRHTLSAAYALLCEAGNLYRRAFIKLSS